MFHLLTATYLGALLPHNDITSCVGEIWTLCCIISVGHYVASVFFLMTGLVTWVQVSVSILLFLFNAQLFQYPLGQP